MMELAFSIGPKIKESTLALWAMKSFFGPVRIPMTSNVMGGGRHAR
jgi:hypothetical protein